MVPPEDRLAEMRAVQAWALRVRPIIASRQSYAKKREDLIAAGCSDKNAAYIARMSTSEFDITNNSVLREKEIRKLEMGARVK